MSIVIIIVTAIIILGILSKISDYYEEQKKEIESKKRKLEDRKKILLTLKADIVSNLQKFFSTSDGNYTSTYNNLNNIIRIMQSTISEMQSINEDIIYLSRKEDQTYYISKIESRNVFKAQHIVDGFKEFGEKIYNISLTKMIDKKNYGKVEQQFYNTVSDLNREVVVPFIVKCEKKLNNTNFDTIYKINIEEILMSIWFFATEKIFSASDFQRAQNIFHRIYKYSYVDTIVADLYAKKKMGGEDILYNAIKELLRGESDANKLTLIASGLMWMSAYKMENIVLQHMLTSNMQMTSKIQERLHSLTNSGGKAPSGFNVVSSEEILYFDVSALAWKEDEYVGLFENLAFQDATLSYSLAIHDEDKNLFITCGIKVPTINMIHKKLKMVFAEEYGEAVYEKIISCIALSGSGEERMEGILICPNECCQMGILVYVVQIGKKLGIKFYTLFMPTELDITKQKQQALSMYKRLSPSVAMWESSIKDTTLMTIQQLLNSSHQYETDGAPSDSNLKASTHETVF